MTPIIQKLTACVSSAFEKAGYDPSLGVVTVSDRADLCQFQCNGALGGAKIHHKAPRMIAEDVAAILKENGMFSLVDVAGPGFINLSLSDEILIAGLDALSHDAHLGVPQTEKPETVVVDYGGPNVAKALHIGHLRSAIIGEAVKRLAKACGNNAIGDVHLGDWGTPMGLVMTELHDRHPDWACFKDDFDPSKDLLTPFTRLRARAVKKTRTLPQERIRRRLIFRTDIPDTPRCGRRYSRSPSPTRVKLTTSLTYRLNTGTGRATRTATSPSFSTF